MFSDNIHTAGNHGNGVLRGLVVEAGMGSNMRTEMCRTLQGMCRTVPQRKGLTHFFRTSSSFPAYVRGRFGFAPGHRFLVRCFPCFS